MNYCTLFNSYYLSRGLALYDSLLKHAKTFHLFIFAFDDDAYEILTQLNLTHATIISLKEFETPELLAVKPQRTIGEYCWTCTSSVILHCLEKYNIPEVCYLDADLYFFGSPEVLLEEVKEASILITEHHYSPEYDHSQLSGKYCVQFMLFKNDENALQALKWWQASCIEWCFNRAEEGKFGDQKYLDDWLERFKGVKVLTHLGGGVAPWNVQRYALYAEEASLFIREKITGKQYQLIFYHFHALKFINDKIDFGHYKLSSEVKHLVYKPYVNQLLKTENHSVNVHGKSWQSLSFVDRLRNLKRRSSGVYNLFSVMDFK